MNILLISILRSETENFKKLGARPKTKFLLKKRKAELVGKVVDLSGDDYTYMELMFASLGFSGLVFALLLLASNRKHRLGLELPTKEAQAMADASS